MASSDSLCRKIRHMHYAVYGSIPAIHIRCVDNWHGDNKFYVALKVPNSIEAVMVTTSWTLKKALKQMLKDLKYQYRTFGSWEDQLRMIQPTEKVSA